jgi:hypothetical protein
MVHLFGGAVAGTPPLHAITYRERKTNAAPLSGAHRSDDHGEAHNRQGQGVKAEITHPAMLLGFGIGCVGRVALQKHAYLWSPSIFEKRPMTGKASSKLLARAWQPQLAQRVLSFW